MILQQLEIPFKRGSRQSHCRTEKEEHAWSGQNDNKRKLAEIQALTDDIAIIKPMVSQLAATK